MSNFSSIINKIIMKNTLLIICSLFFLNTSLCAQKNELIIVKAGTKILDYFPLSKRYLYSEFVPGRIWFKSGTYSDRKLNYNHLTGEMEFIQAHDTLSFANKKDIELIMIAQDTFYYDKGYIEQLRSGNVRVGLKQYYELKEIQNKDSYGTASSGSSTISYNSLPNTEGNFYKLTANKDIIFKRTVLYYMATPESGFVLCSKNNMIQLFPLHKSKIKSYLKANKIKFDSRDDILKLADFLKTL